LSKPSPSISLRSADLNRHNCSVWHHSALLPTVHPLWVAIYAFEQFKVAEIEEQLSMMNRMKSGILPDLPHSSWATSPPARQAEIIKTPWADVNFVRRTGVTACTNSAVQWGSNLLSSKEISTTRFN
jgi:hypothetical protein